MAAALEFTRRQMAAKVAVKPAPEPDKSNECWWCGDRFKVGEIPHEEDGQRMHGKCKREIARLPGDVQPR